MGNVGKRLDKLRMQKLGPGAEMNRIIDKYSTRDIGGPERSIKPILVTSSASKLEISGYVRDRCLKNSSFTMTTKPDGVDRAPKIEKIPLVIWNDDVDVNVEKRPSLPPFQKIIEKIVKEGERKKNRVA